ncbi:DEAD/DEAH box helicase [Tessaracoccus sp. OS52]|uniref:DEAD/DEAH box helicase n=1 Tax=Tessaracoccus sp. OS52 TaxID=2886691 RepID=UPI001D0F7FB1|nr:DEAD/DEAH box helicase [Tessaracoccus sp. OS52]MCC2592666.1 DEAD/DEAH box helicase [Tessaracoccus sp. OS52]
MRASPFESLPPAYPGRAAWGTASSLRAWQQEAFSQYCESEPRDFLCVATPGAGKTTFALRVAHHLLSTRKVKRIIVVTPTEHLKVQWADAAARVGIQLDPGTGGTRRGRSREYDGSVVTYAGVALRAYAYEAICHGTDVLVIFDEVHHAGDSRSWGDAIAESFAAAARRLSLTGTPFRSDDHPIPFVTYEEGAGGVKTSRADYTYGYAEALADHVVRPVLFMNYGGPMRWRTKAGDELAVDLGTPLTKDLTAQAWRTALAPTGEWIPAVLGAANTRLTEARRHVHDAGALVIATNQTQARAYARILQSITGEKPCVVLSDDANASSRIDEFSQSEDRWMVAVRMVSEGVDVPRLAVGVYATATSTPLFFAQAVGRFVRSRRRGEVATVFLPTVPILLSHAASLERQRDHVLGRPRGDDGLWSESEALMAEANSSASAGDDLLGEFEALESQATFDHVLFDSQAFGMHAEPLSEDEQDYLGLPGLLEPDQVHSLLSERQSRQLRRRERQDRKDRAEPSVALHRALAGKRKELNSLVAQFARSEGIPHSHVHANLRRECGGPKVAEATQEQVDERITAVRRWLRGA